MLCTKQQWAFVRLNPGVQWAVLPVPYRIHSGGLPTSRNGSEFLAVQRAFRTWQNIQTSRIGFQYEGTTSARNGGNDGENIISFQSDFTFGSGVIAVTLSSSAQGKLLDADILFNTSDPDIGLTTDGSADAFDIQTVATHEIGHFLGLDHSAIVSATMNPTASRGSMFPRFLRSDDILGASSIYPEDSFLRSTGGVRGRITRLGNPVFGAHVVILDGAGVALVSTLTQPDGHFEVLGLVPGNYSLYAEPLDGPITGTNISGEFASTIDLDFTTTFLGNVVKPTERHIFAVVPGAVLDGMDVGAFPSPSVGLNLTSPGLGLRISQGGSISFLTRGTGIANANFLVLGSGATLTDPFIAGEDSVRLTANISGTAFVGARSLFVSRADGTSALSGGFVITAPPPAPTSISPAQGESVGGTRITVNGSNFRPGMELSLAGIPLEDIVVASPTTAFGTTAANQAGNLTLLAINPDGTVGALFAAFESKAEPLSIDSIDPAAGPPTTLVTIRGGGFSRIATDLAVRFNGTAASIVSSNEREIVCIVPYGAMSGGVTVRVLDQFVDGPAFTVMPVKPSSNVADTRFQYVTTSEEASNLVFEHSEDDDAARLELPFDFSLFSKRYLAGTPLFVATNGWMSFAQPGNPAEWENGPLPGISVPLQGPLEGSFGALPPSLIAPFFDDLTLGRADSRVSVRLLGTAPARRLVIDWQNLGVLDGEGNLLESRLSFEAILFEESNDIAFQYRTLDGQRARGESATVGLQNNNRDQASQFSFNQASLSPGRAIVFRFDATNATYQIVAGEFRQYVPHVIDTTRFRTNLGITNVSQASIRADLTLYDAAGTRMASRSVDLPPGGLTQVNNVVSFILARDTLEPFARARQTRLDGVEGWRSGRSGAVVVTANQPFVVYSTEIDNTSNDPSLFVGRAVGGTQLLIPSTTSISRCRSSLVVQNVGTAPAQVHLRLRDTLGRLLGELGTEISSNGFFSTEDIHASLGMHEVFGPLEIDSLNGVPLLAVSRVFKLDGTNSGFFEAQEVASGESSGLIPISEDSPNFRTNLGINNPGSTPATVQTFLYSKEGKIIGTTGTTVPAGGLVQLKDVNRLMTGDSGTSNTDGYIRFSSDQPVCAYASLVNNSGKDPGLLQSWFGGTTRLLIPSTTNTNQFRSTLTVVNLSSDKPAPVRIVARDREGNVLAESEGLVIAPNGVYSEMDILSALGLKSSFGPLEVRSLSEIPLAAASRVYSIYDNNSGFLKAQAF